MRIHTNYNSAGPSLTIQGIPPIVSRGPCAAYAFKGGGNYGSLLSGSGSAYHVSQVSPVGSVPGNGYFPDGPVGSVSGPIPFTGVSSVVSMPQPISSSFAVLGGQSVPSVLGGQSVPYIGPTVANRYDGGGFLGPHFTGGGGAAAASHHGAAIQTYGTGMVPTGHYPYPLPPMPQGPQQGHYPTPSSLNGFSSAQERSSSSGSNLDPLNGPRRN